MRSRVAATAVSIVALAAVVACGGARALAATASGTALPDTLTVQRENPLKQPVPPLPAVVTISDASQVHALYAQILALPPVPSGIRSCPADFGVSYRMTFLDGRSVLLEADGDPSGCSEIDLADGRHLQPDAAFWSMLAAALHLSPEQLRGVPGASPTAVPPGPAGALAPPGTATDHVTLQLHPGATGGEEDGLAVTLPAAPEWAGTTAMVPLRFVAEAFGASLVWDSGTKSAAVTLGARTLEVQVGSSASTLRDGRTSRALTLATPPVLSGDVLLAPAGAVSGALGGHAAIGHRTWTLSGPPDPALQQAERRLRSLPPVPASTPASPLSAPLYACPPDSPYWRMAAGPAERVDMRFGDTWTWIVRRFQARGDVVACLKDVPGARPDTWAQTLALEPPQPQPLPAGPRIIVQLQPDGASATLWRYVVAVLAKPARPPSESVPADARRVDMVTEENGRVLARRSSTDPAVVAALARAFDALPVEPLPPQAVAQPGSACFFHNDRFRVTFHDGAGAVRFSQTAGCPALVTFGRPGLAMQYPPLASPNGIARLFDDTLRGAGQGPATTP